MLALMMDRPLTLPSILEHAALYHPDREVVTRTVEGPIHRHGYADALARAKRMAKALIALGVKPSDRVATLAWSTHRHFELYFAVTGIGAVLHTINPRLHDDQIAWVARHAEDSVLFFDITFSEQVAQLAPRIPTVRTLVAMTDRAHAPAGAWAASVIATSVRTVSIRGARSRTWSEKVMSKNSTLSSAWPATQAIWSGCSRGLMVCSTAPIPETA